MACKNKIELFQNSELLWPIKISLNDKPVNIAPTAKSPVGINIVRKDSCIEWNLFSLLLYFPWKVLKINLHEYNAVKTAVIIPIDEA